MQLGDCGRGGCDLGVLQNFGKRLPPEFRETDMGVGENQDVALGQAGAEIAGAGDAQIARALEPDASAAVRQRVGRAVGGAVVNDEDFATLG